MENKFYISFNTANKVIFETKKVGLELFSWQTVLVVLFYLYNSELLMATWKLNHGKIKNYNEVVKNNSSFTLNI